MKYLFLVIAALTTTACTIESTIAPSKLPELLRTGGQVVGCNGLVGDVNTSECGEGIRGGKACVLTPADYSGPTCHYTCPNGSTYDIPSVDNYCARVAPYPKK